jgi:GDPmannose 4,6-dehydratase
MSDARDFVEGIVKIIQSEISSDYVFGCGEFTSLREFTKNVFEYYSLDYRDWILEDPEATRKIDTRFIRACTIKSEKLLSWKAKKIDIPRILKDL